MEENQNTSFYDDEGLCKLCHNRYIDRTGNPESVLCQTCREELIKLKVPPAIYAAMAAVLVLVAVAIFFFIPALKEYAVYENAERKAAEGYPQTALFELMNLNEKYPDSAKIAIKSADIGMKYFFPDYAGYAIDTYLVGKEVGEKDYDRLTGYVDELDKYYHTLDWMEALGGRLAESAGADGENAQQALAELCGSLMEGAEDGQYDQALACYYAGYYSGEMEQRIYWFEKSIGYNPMNYMAEVASANTYRRQGDVAKARALLEHAYSINKEDALIPRAFATVEMVEGNAAEALEYARTAYEWYPEGEYVVDTYIVALYDNDLAAEANAVMEEWKTEGHFFDEDLYALLAGEMSVYDYYVGE